MPGDLFDRNKASMRTWNAVDERSAQIGVDERIIFGIITQKSQGNMGVTTTIIPDGIPRRA
jgi:hypothetical protein